MPLEGTTFIGILTRLLIKKVRVYQYVLDGMHSTVVHRRGAYVTR